MSTLIAAAPGSSSDQTGGPPAPLSVVPREASRELLAATIPAPRPSRLHLWGLLAITLFAGFVRFAWPDKPPLWGDEGYTYSRTAGDYRELLDILQTDGFVPLHYNIYWLIVRICWLGPTGRVLLRVFGSLVPFVVALPLAYLLFRRRLSPLRSLRAGLGGAAAAGLLGLAVMWPVSRITTLTPAVMRFVPSLAGTLMAPAMYFLAAHLVRRRVALLAALFTAVSAYAMAYSHDAKMYMHFWLFCTLHVACLLWWFRTGRRVAWLAWIACGLAAVGLHASGMILPAVEIIMLLTQRGLRGFHWRRVVLFVMGLAFVTAGPGGYYGAFNRWVERVDEMGPGVSGINWVPEYNAGRSGPDLALYAVTAHLFSWEWPRPEDRPKIAPPAVNGLMLSITILFPLIVLGMLPWRNRRKKQGPTFEALAPASGAEQPRAIAPDLPRHASGDLNAPAPEPWWRVSFWLGVWIVPVLYGFYCRSIDEFASPVDWLREASWLFRGYWKFIALDAAGLAVLYFVFKLLRPLFWTVLGACGASVVWLAYAHWPFRRAVEPFYKVFERAEDWPGILASTGLVGAVLVLLPAWLWWHAGPTVRLRCKTSLQLLALAAALFGTCGLTYGIVRRMWDGQVKKFEADHVSEVRYARRWEGFYAEVKPAVERLRDDRGRDAMRAALAEQVCGEHPKAAWDDVRAEADRRLRLKDEHWADALSLARAAHPRASAEEIDGYAYGRIASERLVWQTKWESMWMPRYVGIVWPALAIAACALLARLPTRPLRWSAVALLLAANAGNSYARLFAGSEPPMDRITRDVADAQPAARDGRPTNTTTRAYTSIVPTRGPGHPGTLGLGSQQGKYYQSLAAGRLLTPLQYRGGEFAQLLGLKFWNFTAPGSVAADVRASPQLTRIVLWDTFHRTGIVSDAARPVASDQGQANVAQLQKLLGDRWKLASDETFVGRFHWNWKELYDLRRRVFVKVE